MNHYTELLYYIKQIVDADDFVNTITQGDLDRYDLDKSNIFPLLHIDITSGGFTNGQTVIFNIEIACCADHDENKEINVDKFWGNDNEVDNLNECLAVLNRLWGYMHKDFGENNITSSENPSFDKLTGYGKNYLDGWLLTFDVEMPNTTINLCT